MLLPTVLVSPLCTFSCCPKSQTLETPFLPSLDFEGQLLIGCRIERLGYAQGPPPLESQTHYLLCQSLALDSVLVGPGFHTWRRSYTILIDSQVSDYSVWRCGA